MTYSKFAVTMACALSIGTMMTAPAAARSQRVTVTVENLAPAGSIATAPLRIGFNRGTFDAFDAGEAPGAPIISIAEGGSGADWFPAFASADPMAVLGTVGGLLTPGASAVAQFIVDPALNPFFTFAAMVVPSNDYFIGNDNPMAYRLFDSSGNLAITSIDQFGSDIWDAGSEVFDPSAAAFLVAGNNDLRTPQNGVVGADFAELAGFDGQATRAGYVFRSQLTANSPIYRISFAAGAVPEPQVWLTLILGFGVIGGALRKHRRGAATPQLA